ncbi:MAG: PAS domain-containing protein [Snowella sp.]|nr:PAS domain-containing protein [Snowella sp.]
MSNFALPSMSPALPSLKSILIVDDSESDRLTYRRYLQSNFELKTHQIIEAETLEEALSYWQSQRPDLVLMDVNLPDGDGLAFLEAIRDIKQAGKLPVIMMTGQGNERIAVQSMKLGASDYLVKEDINPSSLGRSVRNAFNQLCLTRQLEQLQSQESLVAQISLYIHQFFQLEEIYQAIVQEVRSLLKADRVAVYKFNPDRSGVIVAESVLPPWDSCLNTQIEDSCFQNNGGGNYQLGRTFAVSDIYEANLTPCYLQLLEQFQVRANLVVPILLPNHLAQPPSLWGLLIVHQCSGPRDWQESERYLMQRLAVQLAIALQQAELYQDLQALNSSLEDKVAERTTELQTLLTQHQKSERTFQQISAISPVIIYIIVLNLDGSTYFEHISSAAEMVHEVSLESILNNAQVAFSQIHPDDVEGYLAAAAQSATTLETFHYEWRIITPSGKLKWLRAISQPERRANGTIAWYGAIAETTEQKQTGLKVQELKERLSLVLKGSNDGWWDLDLLTNALYLSPRWWQMLGYEPDEFDPSLEVWQSLIHPEDRDRVNTVFYETLADKAIEAAELEYRLKHKQGHYIPVLSRGFTLRDEKGQPLRNSGTNTDLTALKQKEQELQQALAALHRLNQDLEERVDRRTAALQQSEKRLRETQQFARLGSWELDVLSGKITWSPELYEIFKLNPDDNELSYHDLTQYFHPRDRELRARLFQQAIENGNPFEVDFQIIRADRSTGYILSKGRPSLNEFGQVTRVFGFAMDITERKIAEENLRNSEQRFATLAAAAAAPVGIFRIDQQGNCIYVNDYWSRITGRETQAAFGQGWIDTLHPDDRERVLSVWNEQFTQLGYYQAEARCLRPDGTIRWYYGQALPERTANNTIIGYIGTLTDITERKRYEAELTETNAQLARATRLKDEFLANMSHELRTPLNSVLGMAESLQDGVFGEINPRQWEALNLIERSGRHLLELINDILDLAKIEAGKLELQCEFVSVSQLCESSILFVQHLAFSKQIHLQTQITQPLDPVWLDERRMRQVLINLLSNAVKFTPTGGNVTLAVHLEYTEILFSVIDTGIGIHPQDLDKLFQPFIQIDSSLNRQYAGTGLGLTLVQRITAQHGGRVSVESEVDHGSCFTVRLPYITPDISENPAAPVFLPVTTWRTPPTDGQVSPLILVADDHEGNRKSMDDYLSQKGYRLLLAHNGRKAVELAVQHQPDLIFMDIQMPEMDGLEATRQIRSHPHLGETPIVLLTALNCAEHRDRYLATGANDYLNKPVRFKQLIETIQKFCGRCEVSQ